MTFRIEISDAAVGPTLEFQGLLDRVALKALEAQLRGLRLRVGAARISVRLLEGTELDPECIEPIRALPGTVVEAASPFLARWLSASARDGR